MGLKERYEELETRMVNGKNVENMKLFGRVMSDMMAQLIEKEPEKAEEYIDQLEAVKWQNYLTVKEAEEIVARMKPKAPWGRDTWKQAMEQYGCKLEEWPYYNRCAVWVVMNMIMSDSGETLAKYVNSSNLFMMVHDVAVDKLKDEDGVFNVRKYFGC